MELQCACSKFASSLFIKAADGPGLMRHSSGIIESSHKEGASAAFSEVLSAANRPDYWQLHSDLPGGGGRPKEGRKQGGKKTFLF